MRVAYGEIAPELRPQIASIGPGVLEKLEPADQASLLRAIQTESERESEHVELRTRYMPPGTYHLEDRLPWPLAFSRRRIFQKIGLSVMPMPIDENSTIGTVICDFTPAARRAYRIEQHVEGVTRRIPPLRAKLEDLWKAEAGEVSEDGIRFPITEDSIIYLTHTRWAYPRELLRKGPLINEVQGILFLAE